MANNIRIIVKPENEKGVIEAISRVAESLKPIIGKREGESKTYLIYEFVKEDNAHEICQVAMKSGAEMATIIAF